MRSLVLPGILALSFARSFGQNSDIETILKLNQDFLQSIVDRDTAKLSNILADDFMLIAPNGAKHNKEFNLSSLRSPDTQVKTVHVDSAEARLITPEVGIVTGWTSFVMESGGKFTYGKNCYQDVYQKRDNKWVAVSAHVTLLSSLQQKSQP
jgi:hypothetical protein